MHLKSLYWPVIFSIRVSWLILSISLFKMNEQISMPCKLSDLNLKTLNQIKPKLAGIVLFQNYVQRLCLPFWQDNLLQIFFFKLSIAALLQVRMSSNFHCRYIAIKYQPMKLCTWYKIICSSLKIFGYSTILW